MCRARGSPKTLNLYGKGWKAFDEAGMVHTEPYDFKGNLIEKNKQVISDSELLSVFSGPPLSWNVAPYIVDWTGLSTSKLDSQVFTTTMEYDALNRAMKVTYPEDVNGNRKELTPTYNRAGVLHKVDFDGTEYIKEIAYNAKGQPLLTAYGNSMMTRFAYDENTFRTVRLKTEKYVYTTPLGVHTYTPQSGTTKQDFAYEYDLIGNIMRLHDRTPDSGIQGSILGADALDRLFDYDPLYRVIAANGRESANQNPNILWGDVLPAGTPNANNCQAYNQLFAYDKLGNMMQLQHTGTNAYTRNYVYSSYSSNNRLSRIEGTGLTPPVYSNFSYDVNGNMVSSDTDRNYIWEAADQLRAFYIQAGTSEPSVYAQYLYSGGSRSKKIVRTSGGNYEVTVYDGPFEYCKKVSGLTTYEKNYSHIQGAAEIRTGTAFPGDISDSIVYQLPDHLGSSNVRLNTTGTIIDKEEYYPFGDTSLRTFTYKRYRYVGKEKDSESGLYYYGARYYASWTCRFISVDPLAAKYAFYTPYQYAGNKPINNIDIDGLEGSGNSGQDGFKAPADNMGGTQITLQQGSTPSIVDTLNAGQPELKSASGGDATQQQTQSTKIYTVQSGDSPYKIANKLNFDPNTLIALNPDVFKYGFQEGTWTIREGQELIIPSNASGESTKTGIHYIFENLTPTIYKNTKNILEKNPEKKVLTYEKLSPTEKDKKRYEALKNTASCPKGLSRDEFPYACTKEGGAGANVSCVPVAEQEIQRIDLRRATSRLQTGDKLLLVLVPKEKTKSPQPDVVPAPSPAPVRTPVSPPIPVTSPPIPIDDPLFPPVIVPPIFIPIPSTPPPVITPQPIPVPRNFRIGPLLLVPEFIIRYFLDPNGTKGNDRA